MTKQKWGAPGSEHIRQGSSLLSCRVGFGRGKIGRCANEASAPGMGQVLYIGRLAARLIQRPAQAPESSPLRIFHNPAGIEHMRIHIVKTCEKASGKGMPPAAGMGAEKTKFSSGHFYCRVLPGFARYRWKSNPAATQMRRKNCRIFGENKQKICRENRKREKTRRKPRQIIDNLQINNVY